METVLVTGGAGFVGSHVCKALSEAGYLPVVYDNLSRGHRWAVRWGPLEEGEIADRLRLASVVLRYSPSAVLHFASSIEAGESVRDPATFYENNVSNTLTLLHVMVANGIDRFVFSSSAAVYGNPEVLPIRESHPKSPTNPYGMTKLICEGILSDYRAAYGLRSVSLRYFNATGADPDGLLGEAHEPETHLIPIVLEVAAGQRSHLPVFGDDYDTPDGTCIRDYVHVSDLARAHCLALARTAAVDGIEAFNLGTGKGHSVREVVAAVESVTRRSIPTETQPRREGDPAALVADPSAAMDVLGWTPERTGLDVQVGDAWQWFQARAELDDSAHSFANGNERAGGNRRAT